jgi:hypothetical protein
MMTVKASGSEKILQRQPRTKKPGISYQADAYRGRRTDIRFVDGAQLRLVKRAAKKAGQTANWWMASVLLEAAKQVLEIK